MAPKTQRQGHLDGLCGIYAIVNALAELGHKGKPELIFETACQALPNSRWPSLLWEGTTLHDLKRMIKACRTELALDTIRVSYPFDKSQPPSNEDYWQELDKLFIENPENKCAIIGLGKPTLHWLVAKPARKRAPTSLLFIDSGESGNRRSIPRDDIYAGQRRSMGQKYRVERKELILFEKTP